MKATAFGVGLGANGQSRLKQSLASSLTPHFQALQPKWRSQAHRVVEVPRRLQAVSAALLQPVVMGDNSYVLRELQPVEDRIALGRSGQTPRELNDVVRTMGQMVTWAQLRSAAPQCRP